MLLFLFIPLFWWIRSFEPDELEAITVWRNKNAAWVCKVALIIINISLIAAIALTQKLAADAPAS